MEEEPRQDERPAPVPGWLLDYFTFVAKLLGSPVDALAAYRGHRIVAPLLGAYLGLGIGVGYLIVFVGDPALFDEDPAWIVEQIRRVGRAGLPAVVGVVVCVGAILMHAVARLAMPVVRFGASAGPLQPKLGGTLIDTINASLAFAGIFIPLVCVVVVALSLAGFVDAVPTWGLLLLTLVPTLFLFWYLPRCLAGTHPYTSVSQAFFAFVSAVMAAIVLSFLFRLPIAGDGAG